MSPQPITAQRFQPLLALLAVPPVAWLVVAQAAQVNLFCGALSAAIVAHVAPRLILVTSLASVFAFLRVEGLGGLDISLADVALAVTAAGALRFVPTHNPRYRALIRTAMAFQVILALVVIAHPTQAAVLEWFHRIVLVAGAISVGAAIVHVNATRLALRFFYVVALAFAVDAIRLSLRSGFADAFPFGLQKNPAGLLLAFAVLTLVVAPRLADLPSGLVPPLAGVLVLGVIATQSRGSMIALLLGWFGWAVKTGRVHRTLPVALVVGGALVAVVYVTTDSELEARRADPETAHFSPIGTRLETNRRALEIWREQPILGAGLRYFRDASYHIREPHNVILVTATEGGIVGLVGLMVLIGGAFRALRGLTGDVARLARLALVMRLVAGSFDIYWVAGTGSLPWILVGVAVAQPVRTRTRELAAS